MKKFEGKAVFITGGTSGMGLSTAEEFIREGAKVIITGRSKKTVDDTVEKLGPNAYGFVSDAGKMSDLLTLQKEVTRIAPAIDVVFANAGFGRFAPIEAVTEQHFDELFNALVKGSFFTVQQLLPIIHAGGSIILNTSIVTEMGFPNFSIYSAAKSAVQSFVKTLAAECTSRQIRVNGVSPGYISTNIFESTGMTREQIDGTIAAVTATTPLKRFGHGAEIAKTVSFLASSDASYIHGTEIVVDGGYTKLK
jgi:NAD(P)-dependent dehydrogenase (short-subunit alcohol dehydrogenase family)